MILQAFSSRNDPVICFHHHPQSKELYQVSLATDPDQTFKTDWESLGQVAVKQNTHAKSTHSHGLPQQETHALVGCYSLPKPINSVLQIKQPWDLFNTKRRQTFELHYTTKYQQDKRLKYTFIYTFSCMKSSMLCK